MAAALAVTSSNFQARVAHVAKAFESQDQVAEGLLELQGSYMPYRRSFGLFLDHVHAHMAACHNIPALLMLVCRWRGWQLSLRKVAGNHRVRP